MTNFGKIDPTQAGIVLVPIVGAVIGLINIFVLKKTRLDSVVVPKDTHQLRELVRIAGIIREGARSFLIKEYTFMLVFVFIMGAIVGGATEDGVTVAAFILGAFLSASCGWIGMSVAVDANYKTTYSATLKDGLNESLKVAFASGAVMGFGVVCSGVIGLVIMYGSVQGLSQDETRYLAGFGFGASSIALFARVGGGIYTKAADVGADLVGKVESGLPEDDPRNPATIADNVGDNVGDVAGMGADLFESFVGGIIASIQLSQSFALHYYSSNGASEADILAAAEKDSSLWPDYMQEDVRVLIAFPFWIVGFGILCAVVGLQCVKTKSDASTEGLQERLLNTIRFGMGFTGVLSAVGSFVIMIILFGTKEVGFKLWGCSLIGLVAGVAIGYFTEYATSFTYKPTQTIAKKGKTGAATVVIQGIGIGMLSTMAPTLVIFASILICYELGQTYGIAIASVGMLSTLGITLATDAFGPVADNAGGLAEMAEFPEAIRDTTDGLDALGNTTAATGKGFAIGSAVLSALALLSAFKDDAGITVIDVSRSEVLAGAIFGACLPFIFAAMTMMAVGRAATMMIVEVRRQIKELHLLSEDDAIRQAPDYNRCVAISTEASVLEMIIPGVLAIVAPLFIGYLLGAEALGGMLVGGICCGFMLAVYMANAGGAWDNAKKWVEGGNMFVGGVKVKKGTAIHDATVTGDTIGDPFKDTSGPSLNILMKLMTMISLVFASKQFKDLEAYDKWYVALVIAVLFIILATSLTMYMRAKGFGKTPKDLNVVTELTEKKEDDGSHSVVIIESKQETVPPTAGADTEAANEADRGELM